MRRRTLSVVVLVTVAMTGVALTVVRQTPFVAAQVAVQREVVILKCGQGDTGLGVLASSSSLNAPALFSTSCAQALGAILSEPGFTLIDVTGTSDPGDIYYTLIK